MWWLTVGWRRPSVSAMRPTRTRPSSVASINPRIAARVGSASTDTLRAETTALIDESLSAVGSRRGFAASTPASSGSNPPLGRSAAEDLARTLRAVADPTRLQLLSVILDSADGRATVTQLTEALGLRQPTVTHHVRILVEDGLLEREPDGKFVWLSVAADRRPAIEDLLR